jgi:predicted Zn-dependent protease
MQRRSSLFLTAILVGCAALALAGCASSPKSGGKKKEIILHTEYDDKRVGADASKQVASQMGLLEDAQLDAYISRIGRKLLRGIPRSRFGFKFAVVDQIEPNAFALPGGYIFISRGLLLLTNDEDELANVIGHEITHVAQRHAAARQAMMQRMNPLAFGWAGAGQVAAYGRDMERDADRGGQILAAAAGYDPMGMSTFLGNMGKAERLTRGFSRRTSFFDTHPGAQERAAVNASRAHEMRWRRDPSIGDPRASLMAKLDGMPSGQRPEAGIFVGDEFLHPELDFRLRFPHGWPTQNTAAAVGAIEPRGQAVIFMSADQPKGDPRAMAESYVEKESQKQNLEVKESEPVKIGAIDSWRMLIRAGGRGGSVSATVTFIPYREATWRITGASASRTAKRFRGLTLQTTRSFAPLTDAQRSSLQVEYLRLATAQPGESLSSISQRTGNAWDGSRTAVYNGIFANHRFEGGELVKIVHVEPYVPGPR